VREGRFTDAQKFEIALEMITGKLSQSEVCRKWNISSTYAYKLKDRALAAMRAGVAKPAGKSSAEVEGLKKKVADLQELAGDQALVIRYLKKTGEPDRL
jgi:transposase-like protein